MTARGTTRPLSIAPMMARTDRHYRYLMRRLTREVLLYTEMVTTGAILHGDRDYLLDYHPDEHPIALQVGGDDPDDLAECARIAEARGYDEINLNIGCPSERVQRGSFGACLMATPDTVARGVAAMRSATALPVTVKHRIGIDDMDTYDHMRVFVEVVASAGADRFTVHARKAWLKGLSPKENRNVPPLRYDEVHRLKRDHPELIVEINGGFTDLARARDQLEHVDAVMIGRHAYDDPSAFSHADRLFFGSEAAPVEAHDAVLAMLPYIEGQLSAGARLIHIARHMLHLFVGRPGARQWRRAISESAGQPNAGPEVLQAAVAQIPR